MGGVVTDVRTGAVRWARALTGGGERRPRRVWTRPGRAHIEVRGLTGRGEPHETTARELTAVLRGTPGVRWAEVNAVLGQVVVATDEDLVDAAALLGLVEKVEEARGSAGLPFAGDEQAPPFDTLPAVLTTVSLAADCLGLVMAAARRVVPLPLSSPLLRVPVVVAESQPRVRRLLERRLGRAHADLLLGVSNAVAHSLTAGISPLVCDAVQRVSQLGEFRARRAVWERLEDALVGAVGEALPPYAPDRPPRPAPVPSGPVERCGERTSAAGLLGAAGVWAWARGPQAAGQVILATVPKAAGMGREAFSARLGRDLAGDGVVPMNGHALRLLDRVSDVVIDSAVLCAPSPRLLSVSVAGEGDEVAAWGAAQSLLTGRSVRELCGPGPWEARGWRLERPAGGPAGGPDGPDGLPLDLRDPRGRYTGRVVVGCDLDPLADALVGAARSAGRRLTLTQHASAAELMPWSDLALPASASLAERVRALQREDGRVVLLVAAAPDGALAAADVGVAVRPATAPGAGDEPGPAGKAGHHWSADLICGPGLTQVWRILSAVDDAREVSARSARLSMGGSALGALIAAAGTRRTPGGLPTSPVYGAALLAQFGGFRTARDLGRRPPPRPRIRGAWHALGAREALMVLSALNEEEPGRRVGDPARAAHPLAGAVRGALAATGTAPLADWSGRLLTAVREELRDPLTPVLALGAAASAAVGSGVDSTLVVGVMAGNAVISGAQRLRAERALAGLTLTENVAARRVSWTPPATARTDPATEPDADPAGFLAGLAEAEAHTVAADDLRIGDVIALGPSDVVPADARLLVSDRLEVDEAALTGEPVPVGKNPAATPGADLAERSCMLYQGCTVLAGTGHAVVVATGAQTEAGRAADLAGHATTPPGIEAHLADLARAALPAVGAGGAAVTLLGLLRGLPVRQALASGVAVAVAAVPEGLPLVAAAAQSAAARRLSRHGVLTRSVRVLEALGRVDVLCFDKTGTLTEGRLTVTRLATPEHDVAVDSPAGRRILRAAARACPRATADQPPAHATDRAVLDAADRRCPPDRTWQPHAELPFEASRGYSACLGSDAGHPYLAVKGAPETVLARCTTTLNAAQEVVPLGPDAARGVHRLVDRLAQEGLRILAVARALPATGRASGDEVAGLVADLTLLGFLAIADAPRPGAARAVARLAGAGVRVTVVTGDHPATAAAVARRLGVPGADRVMTGAELDALPEADRVAAIERAAVFARVSPEHKARIVQALRRGGHVVAMTGDGVNDAAAIRLADVGIGLAGHGSASARAAADLVLTDPDPDRILRALIEGRTLWRSVRDAVAILVGGNAGEVAFTLLGTALAGRAPLSTRQLLLVNLLTDMLPALAVGLAPTRAGRSAEDLVAVGPGGGLLGPDLTRLLVVRGTATTLGATTAWQVGRFTGLRRRADTMGLAALITTQLGQTLITDWHSPLVLGTVVLSAGVLVTIVQVPGLSHFFGCTPLGPFGWATVGGCAATATLGAAVVPRLVPAPARDTAG